MLRLAEVYLNYCEAVLGNADKTTDATALELFNKLRARAAMPEKESLTFEDIRHEARVELAFEGIYWYQLVRRAYYQQQDVVNYLNNQHRNASYYSSSTHTYEISDSWTAPGPSVNIATKQHLTLPMSDTDQTKNPNLKTDSEGNIHTTPYSFSEREVGPDDIF